MTSWQSRLRVSAMSAQHNALEEIKTIVWTPKITMLQLRKRIALVLRKLAAR